MSKKNKRKLQQLIAKKQQISQINTGVVVTFNENPVTDVVMHSKPTESFVSSAHQNEAITSSRASELKRTAVSIVIIIILLAGAVIFDHKAPYFNNFGAWLYRALRLNS